MITTNRTIYYTDWNVMIECTSRDIEFLDKLELIFEYQILIDENRLEVEFKIYN